MADKKYTREDLGDMMRAEVVTLATELGMDQDQAFKAEFEDTVEWILENQDGGGGDEDKPKAAAKKSPPVKRKAKTRVVKKDTKEEEEEEEPAAVVKGLHIDLSSVEKKVDELLGLSTELNAQMGKDVESLGEQIQELRADLYITQQLVIAHFKLFENPKGVDKMVKKLEDQVGGGEDGGND